jgi:four helix bundle protein
LDQTVPVLHKISELYKKIYVAAGRVPKKDRFGLYLKIETVTLEVFELCLTASLESKLDKLQHLSAARTKVELLKRFVRMAYELKIIEDGKYLDFEADLQEISKMINGWIKYLK